MCCHYIKVTYSEVGIKGLLQYSLILFKQKSAINNVFLTTDRQHHEQWTSS